MRKFSLVAICFFCGTVVIGGEEPLPAAYLGAKSRSNQRYYAIQDTVLSQFKEEPKSKKQSAHKSKKTAKKKEISPLAEQGFATYNDLPKANKNDDKLDLTFFKDFRKRRKVNQKVDFYTGVIPRAAQRYITNFVSDYSAPRQAIIIPYDGPIESYQWNNFVKKWNYSRFQTNLYGKRLYISYKNKYNFPGPFNPGSKLDVEIVRVNDKNKTAKPTKPTIQASPNMSNADLSNQKARIKAFYMRGQKPQSKRTLQKSTVPASPESTLKLDGDLPG